MKTNHLVNFIASTNFIQDVAYGTKKLKLDSGEKIPFQIWLERCCLHEYSSNTFLIHHKGVTEKRKKLPVELYRGVTTDRIYFKDQVVAFLVEKTTEVVQGLGQKLLIVKIIDLLYF